MGELNTLDEPKTADDYQKRIDNLRRCISYLETKILAYMAKMEELQNGGKED
jgi:hypothetical protein